MSKQITTTREYLWRWGGFAAVVLVGVTQAWAQTDTTTPTGNAQANESSVLLPPPTPPGAHNNATQPTGAAQPASQEFMRPSVQMPVPPQPPSGTIQRPSSRAQLGVYVVPTDGAGVRISNVTPGTAAEAAGLISGDILLSYNGKAVTDPQQVIDAVHQMNVGDQVELRIWRNGAEQNITATLGEMKNTPIAAGYDMTEYGSPEATYVRGGWVRPYSYYYGGPVVRRYYSNYPGTYYYNGPYGYYSRGWGYPYRAYYGPGYGYYGSPSIGVRVGPFGFGWR